MNPTIKSKEIKGFSQGFVTITIPCNVSYKYFNSLKDPDGGKNLDFHDPEVCMAAVAATAVCYFQAKLNGAPRDNLAARAPVLTCEALGSKGLVITITTTKSQTVLRKCCVMFAAWFVPNKLYGMYGDMAKVRSKTTLGAKGKTGYAWACNQLVSGAKSANILVTTTAKVDEAKFKTMMKKKFRADNLPGGVKPTPEKDSKDDSDCPDTVGSYEDTHTAISISKGHSAEVVRHFLWEYKIRSHYDGSTLWVGVHPKQWATKKNSLKTKKTIYVVNKWSKLAKSKVSKLGYALMAITTPSGNCTSSELAGISPSTKAADISSLLDQLF
jgi:hypothetical protein